MPRSSIFFRIFLFMAGISAFVQGNAELFHEPLHLVVPQAPGGATDTLARLWAQFAGNELGRSVVVDNKAGANGVVGATYAARQPANGNTLFLGSVSNLSFNPFIYKNLSYSPKDFDGISLLAEAPHILIASKKSGIKNFKDFVDNAKTNPEKLNFASSGLGNSTHLIMEIMMRMLGIKLTHIPYQGSVAGEVSVIAGNSDVMVDTLSTAIPQVKAGKVTPLVIIGSARVPDFPDTPTLDEVGLKDFPEPNWFALVVPAGTPKPVIDKFNEITVKFLHDDDIRKKLAAIGFSPKPTLPSAVRDYTERDARVFGPIIQEIGLSNK